MRLSIKFIVSVLTILSLTFLSVDMFSQEKVYLSGSIHSDMLFPESDSIIGTGKVTENFLSNTYINLNLGSQYIEAGARLEFLNNPLPGFEKRVCRSRYSKLLCYG